MNARFTAIIPLLIIQILIFFFAVTCQDSSKRIIVDDDSLRLYHLTGEVVDHQTDLPISDLVIRVNADSTYETVTDSTGRYSLFFEASPGDYKVTFEKSDYASMYGYLEFPESYPPSTGQNRLASLPAWILVTKDVRSYPLTKQVEGTVLGYTWDYPEWPDDSVCILPRIMCIQVYISYAGVEQIDQAEMTLDYALYWACTDIQGGYYLGDIPHADSAFIGTIPFCWEDLCFYGSRSAISFDNSEPVDLLLVAAPIYDAMYEYTGYDSLQRQIVSGWLGMNDPDSMGQVEGAWSIKKCNSEPWPDDLGPQDGSGSLVGRIHGNKLSIDLNPDWADNNVILAADTGYYRLAGTWHYNTFAGEANSGTFEANRLGLGSQ